MTRSINNRLRLALLFSILLFSFSESCVGQTNSPPNAQWHSIFVLRVKPDMFREYQSFQKNETIPGLQKGGVKWRDVWETAIFGEAFQYWFVLPIDSLAQLDDENPFLKALGQEGERAYRAKARQFILGSNSYGTVTRPDLSYYREMTGPPKLAVVNISHVALGRNMEFENLIKKEVLPVMRQAGVAGYWVEQSIFGGDENAYFSLVLYDSFTEIGRGSPFMRVLGQEGANKLSEKFAGIVTHAERYVARYNADLSFAASPQPKPR